MSDNWVVQNLENALEVWNDKLSEIWQLITQSPQTFKGGSIWSIICSIHGALQAIGYSTDNRADTVRAFHHRFRGMEGTELDAQDLRILHALTRTADTTPPAPASP